MRNVTYVGVSRCMPLLLADCDCIFTATTLDACYICMLEAVIFELNLFVPVLSPVARK